MKPKFRDQKGRSLEYLARLYAEPYHPTSAKDWNSVVIWGVA